MLFSSRPFAAATLATTAVLFSGSAIAQSFTSCNPLQSSCPADPALGKSINIDFTKGGSSLFTAAGGTPTYDSNGVSFTVAKSGDSPQLISLFYIMFGRVEITVKAATGAGIVSSLVFQSDCLDEIDNEWLGADNSEVQTNYFGKGIVGWYNRGQFNPTPNNQDQFITYVVDWTSERIVWTVGETVVRTLTPSNAEPNQYPQTPMQIKFGSWAGGDPTTNPPGTVGWARGPTDYSKGPFTMLVRSVKITDYSTGSKYSYGDSSGSWQSIRSEGGVINGNLGGAGNLETTGVNTAGSASATGVVPAGGIGSGTWGSGASNLPPGWVMTPDGKVVPSGSATGPITSSPYPSYSPQPGSGPDTFTTITTSNPQGVMTTMTALVQPTTTTTPTTTPTTTMATPTIQHRPEAPNSRASTGRGVFPWLAVVMTTMASTLSIML